MTDLTLTIERFLTGNPILAYICMISILGCLIFMLCEVCSDTNQYMVNNPINNSVKQDDDSELSNTISQGMSGTFEIHITIDPKNNYVKLLDFIEARKYQRKFKLVYAVSSAKNNQYMLSYFTHKSDDKLAVNSALDIAKDLEKNNIVVIRVKIEAHDASNIPTTDRDYRALIKHLSAKYNHQSSKQYFEFHCKVNHPELDLEQLERDISNYKATAISYNLCSSNKNPLLTVRVYDAGLTNAIAYKNTVMNHLKRYGYVFEDKIQQEFAVYDSGSTVDDGWS
jgi:hypothetical protein